MATAGVQDHEIRGLTLGSSRMEGEEEVAQPPDHGEKSSWPELVGSWYMDAAFTIAHERPGVSVHFYDFDWTGPPPAGFDPKRVALFSDAHNLVSAVPKIG
uniref:Uncharacterized protein n=1 Tax=Aegilops tauschii TaxID=37682 RepID=M8BS51_AEGTA